MYRTFLSILTSRGSSAAFLLPTPIKLRISRRPAWLFFATSSVTQAHSPLVLGGDSVCVWPLNAPGTSVGSVDVASLGSCVCPRPRMQSPCLYCWDRFVER